MKRNDLVVLSESLRELRKGNEAALKIWHERLKSDEVKAAREAREEREREARALAEANKALRKKPMQGLKALLKGLL